MMALVSALPHLDPDAAVRRASALAAGPSRRLLGLTGAPGSGKSTYAAWLVERLRDLGLRVALVPMDGFHLAHAVLTASGEVVRKGAPHTFDAPGYAALLARLRVESEQTVWAPRFDRDLEDAIAGSIPVDPDVHLVVTEGNYLLLDEGPWAKIRRLLDECWYVEVADGIRHQRLAARHRAHGRDDADAWDRTLGSDEANAKRIGATRGRADALVSPEVS
jgi:pantothenate kinase